MKENKNRLLNLDIAKGIGIILVLFRHTNVGSPLAMQIAILGLGNYIMPVFYFASGYTFRPGRGAAYQLKKRIPMLLRIYFMYSIGIALLMLLVSALLGSPFGWDTFFIELRDFFLGKNLMELIMPGVYQGGIINVVLSPFWFLVQMILASFLYYPLAEKFAANRKAGISAIALLFAASFLLCQFRCMLLFNLQVTPAFAGYMLLGAVCGQAGMLEAENGPFGQNGCRKPKWILCGLAGLAGAVILGIFFPGGIDVSTGFFMQISGYEGIGVLMVLLQTICGGFFFFWICTLISLRRLPSAILSWFGRNTLPFYLTHMFIGETLFVLTGWSVILLGAEVPYAFLKTTVLFLLTMAICALWTVITFRFKKRRNAS